VAPPITYSIDGKQYVSGMAGLEKILDGALVERGMPRFGELNRPAVAELRAYLLDQRKKLAAQR